MPEPRREQYLERPLPSNEDAERVILGSILMNNDHMAGAVAVLEPSDFYSPINKRIFAAMIAVHENGEEIEPIKIGEEIKKEGAIDSIGGVTTIAKLTDGLVNFSTIPTEYIKLVKEKKVARDLIRVCNIITSDCLAEDDEIHVTVSNAKHMILELANFLEQTSADNFLMMNEIVPRLEQLLTNLRAGISYAIPTGFPKWDDFLLDGFSKGDLHVIVGRTGHGKSALALNCARNQAMHGQLVGVISREMSDLENGLRLISSQMQIPRWHMRKGIHEETYNTAMAGMAQLAQLQIAFDTKTKTVEEVTARAKSWVQNKGMSILYVDYIGLLVSMLKHGSRAETVAYISRKLKEIAMDNGIPVVALSQFNRGAKDADISELLEHMKESSGIEQDASTVSYIQIDNSVPDAVIKPAKNYVLKNRNGVTFTPVMLDYRGETFTFSQQVSFEELQGQIQENAVPESSVPANDPNDVIPF